MLLASTRMADFSHTATFEFLRRFPLAGMDQVLVMSADNVGSQQMHIVRAELRKSPNAEIIMGKNTMMRKVLADFVESNPGHHFAELDARMRGNTGFVFTNGDLKEVQKMVK